MEAFVLQAAEKAFLHRSQAFEPLDVPNKQVRLGVLSHCDLAWEMARLGAPRAGG